MALGIGALRGIQLEVVGTLRRELFEDLDSDVFRLADGVEDGQEAEPVTGDDEEEDGRADHEQAAAIGHPGDVLDLAKEKADDALHEVLQARREKLHRAGRQVGRADEEDDDNPGCEQRVCDVERADGKELFGGDDDFGLRTFANDHTNADNDDDGERDQRDELLQVSSLRGPVPEPAQNWQEHAETADECGGQS